MPGQSPLGIDRLRVIYANANLALRPRTEAGKIEAISQFRQRPGTRPGRDPRKPFWSRTHNASTRRNKNDKKYDAS